MMRGMASPRQESDSLDVQVLVDSIPALIHTARPEGYLDYFNKPWLEYLGVTLDKVAGWNWTAYVHPEDVEGILAKWRACLATGEIFEYEPRVRRADGEYRWMFHRKVPLRDANGNIVKWYGSSLDIDERKTAEEQLRRNAEELQRSEFYLAEGQRLAHMGSWAFDPSGFYYWSPELFRMHGLNPASKPPSVQEYLDRVHPHDRESMADLIMGILAKASPFDATKRIVDPNGEVRYIRCVGVPLVDNQGLKKYVGSALDVTEHELLTQELRRRDAYLTGAQRLSHTGSFGCKLSTGEMFWSEETFRIYGYDRSIQPAVERVLQRVHPEDRALVQERIDRAHRDGKDCHVECRLLLPDDSVKHVCIVAHASKNAAGTIEFIGAVMDVTAQRQARAELEQAFEEIKRLKDHLHDENVVLREQIDQAFMFEEIVGSSPALETVLSSIVKVAPTDSTVLITGETGTGKELIARAIHKRSRRAGQAFISVNCASIPTSLIASELFGHEKGAFTGALQQRQGRFELAHSGTIFLDEIGELPAETQISLLRVLQERQFERMGGNRVVPTDVRVITATNRDLSAAIAAGTFRADLFYRLNVFPIRVPPLRERKEDIPMLVEYFRKRYADKMGKQIRQIDKQTLKICQAYHWPGNIRELQNIIERSVILYGHSENQRQVAQGRRGPGHAPPLGLARPAWDERHQVRLRRRIVRRLHRAPGRHAEASLRDAGERCGRTCDHHHRGHRRNAGRQEGPAGLARS